MVLYVTIKKNYKLGGQIVKRKVVVMCLLTIMLCTIFCMSGVAFADTLGVSEVNQYVYDYANEFVKYIDGGVIKEAIPIYDIYDDINSCCFTIYVEEKPYMYIILDNYYREGVSPIIELGFGEYNYNKDEKIVNLNYIDYGIKKNNVVTFDNQEIDVRKCKVNYTVKNKISLLSGAPIMGGYFDDISDIAGELNKFALMPYYNSFEPYIQSDLVSNSILRGSGICGATVAMNVLKFYYDTQGYFDYNFNNYIRVYNQLRRYQTSKNEYNIENFSKIKKALTSFVKEHSSLKITATNYLINSWTYIYNDINNGKLVAYQYDGYSSSGDTSHAVLVVGAVNFKNPSSKYIYVADTSNRNLRWLNYGYHDGIGCMSIKIYE